MADPADKTASLDVHVVRRVHPGLTLDITLKLGAECGVVFGNSGAGKTTLLRLIAGLEVAEKGQVRLAETLLFDAARRVNLPLRSRRIGVVFQDDLLFPHLDVAANIRFGIEHWSRQDSARRVAEVAALCGVEALLERRPETLSGGERQRVGLARALAPRPRLLLCDEPVSALDLASRHLLIERLRAVQRAEAIPVLYVTHSPAEAVSLGSTLFLIDGGRLIDQGVPLDVLARVRSAWPRGTEGLRNTFAAVVEPHQPDAGATCVRLEGGPELVVPQVEEPAGARLSVEILAEEILLALVPVTALSARNVIAGVVERVVEHGSEAEVLVRTGELVWLVSVVEPAIQALQLAPGLSVWLVVKARSCQVLRGPSVAV